MAIQLALSSAILGIISIAIALKRVIVTVNSTGFVNMTKSSRTSRIVVPEEKIVNTIDNLLACLEVPLVTLVVNENAVPDTMWQKTC